MNPLKLAVVGGGPSAFYVASRLLKLLPETAAPNLRVHLYDRLWAPHGLVRYGVAPDHPEVKNCTHKFDQTAQDPRFQFFGNVNVGNNPNPIPSSLSLPLSSLFQTYSHILFATGCTQPTLHAALPPSPPHCIPALSLVHWYTQHPNAPPTPPPLHKTSHVSIIGTGNVSLDIARILLTNADVLARYDVPAPVLDVLKRSNVKHVSIIGRRGPLEAAFTMKELREMMNLPEASMVPLDDALLKPPNPDEQMLTRQQTRVLELLKKGSKNPFGTTHKTWSLDFLRSPIGLVLPSQSSSSSSSSPTTPHLSLSLSHTTVHPTSHTSIPTGTTSTLPTDLIITSLGFRAESAAFYDPALKHLRTLPGRSGSRVITATGQKVKNVYASGWAAMGAKGVLASTMMNAYGVADDIVGDWEVDGLDRNKDKESSAKNLDGIPPLSTHPNLDLDLDAIPEEVQKGINDRTVTTYQDWLKIDAEEVRRGGEGVVRKERERMGWEGARRFLEFGSRTT